MKRLFMLICIVLMATPALAASVDVAKEIHSGLAKFSTGTMTYCGAEDYCLGPWDVQNAVSRGIVISVPKKPTPEGSWSFKDRGDGVASKKPYWVYVDRSSNWVDRVHNDEAMSSAPNLHPDPLMVCKKYNERYAPSIGKKVYKVYKNGGVLPERELTFCAKEKWNAKPVYYMFWQAVPLVD